MDLPPICHDIQMLAFEFLLNGHTITNDSFNAAQKNHPGDGLNWVNIIPPIISVLGIVGNSLNLGKYDMIRMSVIINA